MFKPIAGMNKYMIIPRSILPLAVGGGLLSGIILVSMGLKIASIPYAIIAYILTAVAYSLYDHPKSGYAAQAGKSAGLSGVFQPKLSKPTRYLLATLLTSVGVSLNLVLGADPREHAYLSIAAPIVLSALLFGFETASFQLILACAASLYFFIPPIFDFNFEDPHDVGLLCEFIAFVFLCSWTLKSMFERAAHADCLAAEVAEASWLPNGAKPQKGVCHAGGPAAMAYAPSGKDRGCDPERAPLELKLREEKGRYRELRHRVRNEFQTLLLLASAEAEATDHPEEFGRWILRLRSAAELHALLDEEAAETVPMASYLTTLSDTLTRTFDGRLTITTVVDPEIRLGHRQARQVGLIYTEAAINALKHGFPMNVRGTLNVRLERKANGFELAVSDNGVGSRAAYVKEKFGVTLMKEIATSLGGELMLDMTETGATVRLLFLRSA